MKLAEFSLENNIFSWKSDFDYSKAIHTYSSGCIFSQLNSLGWRQEKPSACSPTPPCSQQKWSGVPGQGTTGNPPQSQAAGMGCEKRVDGVLKTSRENGFQRFQEENPNQTYFCWFSLPQLFWKMVSPSLKQRPGLLRSTLPATRLLQFLWNPSFLLAVPFLFKTLVSMLHLS